MAIEHPQGISFDINNPPASICPRVGYLPYPKTMYHADGRVLVVQDEKQMKKAEKHGYQAMHFADFDYSRTRNGRAPRAEVDPGAPSVIFSKEELEAERDEE